MGDTPILSEFEELVLITVHALGDEAYGVPIRHRVSEAKRTDVAVGAIYVTLDRLEKKGFVKSRLGEATAERGGRAKKYFAIQGAGIKALEEAERTRNAARYGNGLQPGVA